jgi:hypothetical protein
MEVKSQKCKPLLACIALCVGTFAAVPAFGAYVMQPGQGVGGKFQISPMFGLSTFGDLDLGVVASYRFVDNGFIPFMNNSIFGELSFFHDVVSSYPYGGLGVRMRWDFNLHPRWTAYAAPATEFYFGRGVEEYDKGRVYDFVGYVGGFFHVNESISLRSEFVLTGRYRKQGVRAGVTFQLK